MLTLSQAHDILGWHKCNGRVSYSRQLNRAIMTVTKGREFVGFVQVKIGDEITATSVNARELVDVLFIAVEIQ